MDRAAAGADGVRLTPGAEQALAALVLEFEQDGTLAPPAVVADRHAAACAGGYAPSCEAPSWAGAEAGYATGDFARALGVFQPACDAGDALGCTVVGWEAARRQDWPAAHAAFTRACELELPRACAERAFLMRMGLGVPADPVGALRVFDAICDVGVGNACMVAGDMYFAGEGVPADPIRAQARFVRGCEHGDLAACTNAAAGLLATDPPAAAALYTKACDGGYGRACLQVTEPLDPVVAEPIVAEPSPIAPEPGAPELIFAWFERWFPYWLAPLIAIPVLRSIARARELTAVWEKRATEAGLRFSGWHPVVTIGGTFAGVDVALTQRRDNKRIEVDANAAIGRAMPELVVTEATRIETFTTWLGFPDIEVGDPEFDAKFVVRCADPAAARAALDAGTRRALLDAHASLGAVSLEGGRVRFHGRGVIEVERALEILLTLAVCAVSIGGEPGAIEPGV